MYFATEEYFQQSFETKYQEINLTSRNKSQKVWLRYDYMLWLKLLLLKQ